MAALSFMRSKTELAFDGPIQRVRSVLLVVLSYHRCYGENNAVRYSCYVRTVQPRLELETATVVWDTSTCGWAYDLCKPIHGLDRRNAVREDELALARLALDLDKKCARLMNEPTDLRHPQLPPLLLAFAPNAVVGPRPTAYVLSHAARMRMPWRDAWHTLHDASAVSDRLNPTKLRLIDARLFPQIQPGNGSPGSLGEYLDLRRFLGRDVANPLRFVKDAEQTGTATRRIKLKGLLPKDRLAAATDGDVAQACAPKFNRSRGVYELPASLHLSRAAMLTTWTPPGYAMSRDSFVFKAPGVRANLWDIDPRWMPFDASSLSPRTEETTSPALAPV